VTNKVHGLRYLDDELESLSYPWYPFRRYIGNIFDFIFYVGIRKSIFLSDGKTQPSAISDVMLWAESISNKLSSIKTRCRWKCNEKSFTQMPSIIGDCHSICRDLTEFDGIRFRVNSKQ
jgi:hypothetical protein